MEAALNSPITSNSVTITGIYAPTPVTITGDGSPEFRIDGGAWVTSGNIDDGQTLELRLTSANAMSTARTATVDVGGVTATWSVTTGTPILTLSHAFWAPAASGGSFNVTVTSNVAWTVTSNAAWLTRTPASGSNNGTITLTAANNTSGARSGTITVTGGGITRTITVNQATQPTGWFDIGPDVWYNDNSGWMFGVANGSIMCASACLPANCTIGEKRRWYNEYWSMIYSGIGAGYSVVECRVY
jgi:hypothetical protein